MKSALLSSSSAALPHLPVRPVINLPVLPTLVPSMTPGQVDHVRKAEAILLQRPQIVIPIQHVFHAGLYSRTATLPPNVEITGALVKIPTMIVVSGDCYVWLGDEARRIKGHAVLAASAGRKQMFRAIRETSLTMTFATAAKTVEEAEKQFTDEWEILASGRDDARNSVIVTGE